MKRGMNADPSTFPNDQRSRLRAANLRTGWVLAAIALVFFAGIIGARVLGSPQVSIGIIGTAVLLFLVVAIGRNLRR